MKYIKFHILYFLIPKYIHLPPLPSHHHHPCFIQSIFSSTWCSETFGLYSPLKFLINPWIILYPHKQLRPHRPMLAIIKYPTIHREGALPSCTSRTMSNHHIAETGRPTPMRTMRKVRQNKIWRTLKKALSVRLHAMSWVRIWRSGVLSSKHKKNMPMCWRNGRRHNV